MSKNIKLNEYIKEEIQPMQKEVQDIILNSNWENTIEEISKNHKFSDKEILDLKIETSLVFIGLTKLTEFKQNIQNNIIITDKETEEIIKEIGEKILKPIFIEIEKILDKNKPRKNTSELEKNLNFIQSGGNYSD